MSAIQLDEETMRGIEQLSEGDRRIFACECAARVLPLWAATYPNDSTAAAAISIARQVASGELGSGALTQVIGRDAPIRTLMERVVTDLDATTAAARSLQPRHFWQRKPSASDLQTRDRVARADRYRAAMAALGAATLCCSESTVQAAAEAAIFAIDARRALDSTDGPREREWQAQRVRQLGGVGQ